MSSAERIPPLCLTASLALVLTAGAAAIAGDEGPTAEPWARAFGSIGVDETTAVGVDLDEVLFAGVTRSNGAGDADGWVARTDSAGKVLWEIALGGTRDDQVNDMLVTPAGTLLVGSTRSFGMGGGEEGWAVLVDGFGNIVWERTYGDRDDDSLVSVAASPDGYYLLGNIRSNSTGLSNAWAMEIDPMGNVIWQKRIVGDRNDTARGITATAGGLVATIDAQSDFGNGSAAFFRPLVVHMDGDGAVLSARTYSISDGDSFQQVIPMADGSLIALGEAFSTAFFQGEGWLIKIDPMGDVVWDKRVGNHFMDLDFDNFNEGFVNADGSITVLGSTGTGGNGFGALWFARFDASGNLIDDTTYGGPGFDLGLAAAPFGDGVVIGGRAQLDPKSLDVDALAIFVSADGTLGKDCMVEGPTAPQVFEPDGLPTFVSTAPTLTTADTAVFGVSSAATVTGLMSGFPLCGIAPSVCAGDCDGSGTVDFNDLISMLFAFGDVISPVECDADNSGRVDFNDLVAALFLFGPCDGGPGPLPE